MTENRANSRVQITILIFLLVACSGGRLLADTTGETEVNPATGHEESLEISADVGGRVLHLEVGEGAEPAEPTIVSTEPAEGSRIAIKSNGETWAVWEDRETSEIRYSYRNPQSKVWTAETTVSLPGEVSRNPTIAHDGSKTWIAWEIEEGNTVHVAVDGIVDSPDVLPRRDVVTCTSYPGPLDLTLHSELGKVWLTWMASAIEVGWSSYSPSTQTWSPVGRQLVLVSVLDARGVIRARVLEP